MSAFVDTSVLIRYLTGDPPEMLEGSRQIVDEVESVALTDVVLAETASVLLSVYGVPRSAIVDNLVELLCKENIAIRSHRPSRTTVVASRSTSTRLAGPAAESLLLDSQSMGVVQE